MGLVKWRLIAGKVSEEWVESKNTKLYSWLFLFIVLETQNTTVDGVTDRICVTCNYFVTISSRPVVNIIRVRSIITRLAKCESFALEEV